MAKSAFRPLIHGYSREATVTWWKGQPVSAQSFCAGVVTLAARLPDARYSVNLCEHGPNFLLASAGAWCAGQVTLLPQDRVFKTLACIRDDYPDAYCMCDTPGATQMARRCGMQVVDIFPDEDSGAEHWPPPTLSSTQIVAILFTSGSTGESRPHAKSWGELVDGVATFMGSFGQLHANAAILGTVAPQHMFGLETTVMLPLQSGTPLLPQRPMLPGDLHIALGAARAFGYMAAWLITTPLQLRAFHAAGYPGRLARVITSTMPLPLDLAQNVEREWQVSVEEIYGCTEGGMLAHRRTGLTDAFSMAAGIRLVEDPKGRWKARDGHLPAPISLGDRLQRVGDEVDAGVQTFRLLGRDDDIAKIAGKRASLSGLTAKVLAIPGVQDAVVFLPSPDSHRVAAAVVAPSLADAELSKAMAAVMDGAFLPRPLLRVDVLPRTRAMKIAMAPLRDMAIRARAKEEFDAAPRAPQVFTASRSLPAEHPALAGHFPGRPIVRDAIPIVAYTLTNACGIGEQQVWRALTGDASGLRPNDLALANGLDTWIGRVAGLEQYSLPPSLVQFDCRNHRLALACLEQDGFAAAVRAASARHGTDRIGVFVGTSTSGTFATELAYRELHGASGANSTAPQLSPDLYRYRHCMYAVSDCVRTWLDLKGPAMTVSTACSSSAKVFAQAARAIAAGICDAAVVGGVDSLALSTLYGFHSLGLLSRRPCAPFDADRDGISIGEAAGFALLEPGADGAVALVGYGESCDGYHMSSPHPQGAGAAMAMRDALATASLRPGDIDYVNLHGTGSQANDVAEDLAMVTVFGAGMQAGSTKGWTGHTLGAAGITEALLTVMAIRGGWLPGTLNCRTPDANVQTRIATTSRPAVIRHAMSNSFGFGGNNCSLIFGALA